MSTELFPIESVTLESPRLRWMKKHGIITMSFPTEACFGEFDKCIAGKAEGVTGKDNIAQWFCDETGRNGDTQIGMGATEDEAITELAQKWELKLWNEEAAP